MRPHYDEMDVDMDTDADSGFSSNNNNNNNSTGDVGADFSGYGTNRMAYDSNPKIGKKSVILSLSDSPPITFVQMKLEGYVAIEVPELYISAEDQFPDVAIGNLRAIKYEALVDLHQLALKVLDKKSNQHEISTEILDRLSLTFEEGDEASDVLDWMKAITTTADKLQLSDRFVDMGATPPPQSDKIKKFVNDPETRLMVGCRDVPYMGYHFYSQIEDPEVVRRVRLACSDTDYNQMQLYLKYLENMLLLTPGYICEDTTKITNIALVFLLHVIDSRPIEGKSTNDLRGNYLGYLMDFLLRSRLIHAWQRNENTRRLLEDMKKNYEPDNFMVKLCALPTAAERAQFFISSLKRKDKFNLGDKLKYSEYERHLKKYTFFIEGRFYYCFGTDYIMELGTSSDSFLVLKDAILNPNGELNGGFANLPAAFEAFRDGNANMMGV